MNYIVCNICHQNVPSNAFNQHTLMHARRYEPFSGGLDLPRLVQEMNQRRTFTSLFPQNSIPPNPSAPPISQTRMANNITRLIQSYQINTHILPSTNNILHNFDTISNEFEVHFPTLQSTSNIVDRSTINSPPPSSTNLETHPLTPSSLHSIQDENLIPTNSIEYFSVVMNPATVQQSFSNIHDVTPQFMNVVSPFYNFTSIALDVLAAFEDELYDDYDENIRLAERLGVVEVGIDDIEKVSSIVEHEHLKEDDICTICFDKMKLKEEEQIRLLLCGHKYCNSCITQWFSKSKKCPVCNIDLEEKLNAREQSIDTTQV